MGGTKSPYGQTGDSALPGPGMGYRSLRNVFPMMLKTQRDFEPDYRGPIFIWDLDKTYLNTRFSQMRHLLRIPFELGIDKRAVPGTPELLHALRDGVDGAAQHPIFFVSASPHQLSTSVERKMLLDGIQSDGIVFKDATNLVLNGDFGQLRFQVAYKIAALTALLSLFPVGAELHLFGDDVEDDALIYCIFADLAAGRLAGESLYGTLVGVGVQGGHARAIVQQAATIPKWDAVAGIYIRLLRGKEGERIQKFGSGVIGWTTPVAVLRHIQDYQEISPGNYEAVVKSCAWSEGLPGPAKPDPAGFWTPEALRKDG